MNMEKRLPHYPLADIQAQMTAVEAMNLTESSRKGIRQAGMVIRRSEDDIQVAWQTLSHMHERGFA